MKNKGKRQTKRTLIFDKEGVKLLAMQIKKVRESKNYTQRQLAFEADISRSQIDRIENGHTNPTVSTIFAIARTLDVPVSELFQFELPAK